MIPFARNNIEFRQVSSLSLSKFLSSKSFMLAQVVNSNPHKFSSTSKEMLLQTYRIWTDWLHELEEICVTTHESVCTESVVAHAMGIVQLKSVELRNLFEGNPDDFDPAFVELWDKLQSARRPWTRKQLRIAMLDQPLTTAYKEVTLWLCTYMNHLLFNLHEIDYLLYDKRESFKPFIYIDSADVNFHVCDTEHFPKIRLDVYMSLGLISNQDINNLDIKNTLPKDLLESNARYATSYDALLSNLHRTCNTVSTNSKQA